MKRLAIGVLAHVDSGKTTLLEGLLYHSGAIRALGRVDHKNAFLDHFALERERGITIFSKQAVVRTPQAEFTLLDTPGHVDFSTEMERTLQVLDYAVLVIGGAQGIESHTETLWRLLGRYGIPTFLFINKMDIAKDGQAEIISALKARLSEGCVDFTNGAKDASFYEGLALCGEDLLNQYIETGAVSLAITQKAIRERRIFPCFFGAALRMTGVGALLSGLHTYTLNPAYAEAFAARVFKISTDEQGNRLTHLKMIGGVLRVKDALNGGGKEEWTEKTNQIRVYSGARFQAVDEAVAGMVVAVTGLTKTVPGEGLGVAGNAPVPVLEPVLTYRVALEPGADRHTALAKLKRLEEEDPQLRIFWNEQLGEIQLQLMGEVQLEVLRTLIAERLGLKVMFHQGNIAYKETIGAQAVGVGHYEPLRHYAEVHLLLEPLPVGSGLEFATACGEDSLSGSWQRLILTHLKERVHLGVLTGSPVTDIRFTLLAGRAHNKHTEGGDFREATYRAVRQGLMTAQSVLLEPWYEFRLEVPAEAVGRAMADLSRMEAVFAQPQYLGAAALLTGSAPVSAMRDYHLEVVSFTHGMGRLSLVPCGYQPCHNAEGVIQSIGYDRESDLANPADSVFCSHGSAYTVKWDEAPRFMHVERPKPAMEPLPLRKRREGEPGGTLAEDEALLRIFERAYGPIRSNPLGAFRPAAPKTIKPEVTILPPPPQGPTYLLVDGYNIIFAWEKLAALGREDLDAAREKLIHILCNYRGYVECELILVFDAYKVRGNPGEVERVNNITVVYTKEAETADMYIERTTHALGNKSNVYVATSDRLEQMIILGHGARRLFADQFQEEVDRVEQAIRERLAPG